MLFQVRNGCECLGGSALIHAARQFPISPFSIAVVMKSQPARTRSPIAASLTPPFSQFGQQNWRIRGRQYRVLRAEVKTCNRQNLFREFWGFQDRCSGVAKVLAIRLRYRGLSRSQSMVIPGITAGRVRWMSLYDLLWRERVLQHIIPASFLYSSVLSLSSRLYKKGQSGRGRSLLLPAAGLM